MTALTGLRAVSTHPIAFAWLGLALVGQAISLRLIDAGPRLHYQHYKLLARTPIENLLLAFVLVQAVVVAFTLLRRWPAVHTRLARLFRPWQWLLLAAVVVLPAAAVSADPAFTALEFLFASFVQLLNLATMALAVAALPEAWLAGFSQRADALLGPAKETASSPSAPRVDRFALIIAGWVVLVAALLAVFSYQRHPHITDEVAYVMHARFLASGALTLPAPPVPEAFTFYLMEVTSGRWYASTPPGWPALLAVGVRLGVPWLVNPLLGGVNVLLAYLLVWGLYQRRAARIALLLLAVSPWFVFMAMNFMTHTLSLTCALAAAVLVLQARRTGAARWAALAGVMLGLGSLIRPLDGLIIAALVGLWALGLGGKRLTLPAIAALGVGTLLTGALVLPYNRALTGDALSFPLNAYVDTHFGMGRNGFGFGPEKGFGWALDPNPGHSPVDALINANLNGHSLNTELFGWSTGSLLLAAIALVAGRLSRSDRLMVAVMLAVFTAYFFYYYSGGPDFGARYWYAMVIPLVALTVRGMQILGDRLAASGVTQAESRVLAAVGLLALLALVNYFPWRATDKYYHFWGMRPDVRELAAEHDLGRSLVLIRGESHPDYTSAAVYNPLDLHADAPVYAWAPDDRTRAALLAAYPDRPVWTLDGPTITGRGYEVAEQPVPAGPEPAAP